MILRRSILFLVLSFTILSSASFTSAANEILSGKVTDQKRAAIVGAKVVVTDQAGKKFENVTDDHGQFKFDSLPPGVYRISVTAAGFKDAEQDNIQIMESGTETLEFHLQVASVEAEVQISTGPQKGNLDPIYQKLRQQAKTGQDFTSQCAVVNNLILKRDAGTFTLKSGEIYFLDPVEGRVTGAVFLGDGELSLTPPTDVEKHSLHIFTGQPGITEQFSRLILRFTDKTFEEIKASPAVTLKAGGPAASVAREAFHENQQLVRKQLRDNRELRTLIDLLNPSRPGFFNAYIDGKRYNKLVFLIEPLGVPGAIPEEVGLYSYGETDGGLWTAFHLAGEYESRSNSSSEDHRLIDILNHNIDGVIKGAHLSITDKITFKNLVAGSRVIPFDLFGALRVSRVQTSDGADLNFIQEDKNEDSDLGIILNKGLDAGQIVELSIQYEGGDALRDSGGGNFILVPRSTWYPGNANVLYAEDRAKFDMTFRFPKANTFVGTGAPVEPDAREGDVTVAKWSSGKTELAVAGFNYGRFKKKEVTDRETGYNVEFYANQEVPDELKRLQLAIDDAERNGYKTSTTLGSISTASMADSAIADAENSTRIYNAFFGKLPYSRIAMTQQPAGFFGQAWPTLVFMPYIAFMDTTQRMQLLGLRGGTSNFWRYVAPHEIAHQWWGHVIGWDSYHDQWMSEGFAEFSASLYVQFIRGNDKFIEFWEDQRKRIVEASPLTKDRKPFTVGPVTQGYRLNSGKTGGWITQSLIYPKGAYILHMLRMMMYNSRTGDARFQEMMKDFVQTHFNQDVSTEDFKAMVEKHMTPEMNVNRNGTMDWFFNEWVYGTDVPSYKFEYQIGADGMLSGQLTQSGVSDKFTMIVPLYFDMGKGWIKLGAGTIVGNSSLKIKNVKLPPGAKRVAICAMEDVLAVNIQNGK